MANITLKNLMSYLAIETQSFTGLALPLLNVNVAHLRLDSRLIQANDVFIALRGQTVDGRTFISQAIHSGAVAVLADADNQQQHKKIDFIQSNQGQLIPVIFIWQLETYLSALGNYFYDEPSTKLAVIGITGTNGKTTISQLIAQWATLLGKKSATIGTLGNGLYNQLKSSQNTTPSSIDVQDYLAEFVKQQVDVVAMEVSSHGLVLNRVKDVSFAGVVFTNLSRDHLDFHQTMQNYQAAKWSLFSEQVAEQAVKKIGQRVVNFDDEVGKQWISQLSDVIVVSSQVENLPNIKSLNKPYVGVASSTLHEKGVSITIESSWGNGCLESHLYGSFNISNLVLALATLLGQGINIESLLATAKDLTPVCGRMERFTHIDKPTMIVDYAHTPDALEKALYAANEHCQNGQLWVIFGCGGNRDRGKRPLMAAVAEKLAQHVIVTNDNPREEDDSKIIDDIMAGFVNPNAVTVIKDRVSAIRQALLNAKANDIVLVAGKGHEDYQIIGKQKNHYSDRETVQQLLRKSL